MATRADHHREAQDWGKGTCKECGFSFPKRGGYERLCPLCYKLDKGYKVLWGDLATMWLQEELLEAEMTLRAAQEELSSIKGAVGKPDDKLLKGGLLKQAIILCHPDKHGNSERATKVTQALLGLRDSTKTRKKK